MKLKVLDINAKEISDIEISDSIIKLVPNVALLSQYVRVYLHNQRQGTSSTKNRAEVSGSGKKPWRQKGSGRARHGQKRSPIWRTGGIVHGPQPKSWNLSISKKLKVKALLQSLSLRASENKILILENVSMETPKTKVFVEFLNKLSLNRNVLFVIDNRVNTNVFKSLNNIACVNVEDVANLNAYSVISAVN
ncbi:50S ribosomal protein L4, partial [candidate division WWE3 bacterium]|nr:50S ribosomal protein L4 [candidate division WWE3 bacterium]